ncbi:MAG: hypothetical protein DWQ37_15640 [Planctomycetota bacterium]|nr:MAG: hypothetical protein DWQ37_15640 [Planctomycetota bacterium]
MITPATVIQNLDELRDYVKNILCHQSQLEVDAFPLTERVLVRADEPCGIFFCLHGPRSVKLSAIWETQRNTVLFYGSTGERFHKIHLDEAPQLVLAAA